MSSCLVQFTTVCLSNHTLSHLNRCQQMLVHNERNTKPSYANGLRWALQLWKIQNCATQPKHWSLILCSIGYPYFIFASFLSRGCIRVRFLRLNLLTFQKTNTQIHTTHFLTSGPLLYRAIRFREGGEIETVLQPTREMEV